MTLRKTIGDRAGILALCRPMTIRGFHCCMADRVKASPMTVYFAARHG